MFLRLVPAINLVLIRLGCTCALGIVVVAQVPRQASHVRKSRLGSVVMTERLAIIPLHLIVKIAGLSSRGALLREMRDVTADPALAEFEGSV